MPQFENLGYAFEAAIEIKNAARQFFGISFLGAITLENNLSSRKFLEKLGFHFKENIRLREDPEELMYYTLKF